MPLVMPAELYADWLDPAGDGVALLSEACARSLQLPLDVYPVDPRGNNVQFEGPEVVTRVDPVALRSPSPADRQNAVDGEARKPLPRRRKGRHSA
jgi:hypothetical protein